MQGVLEQAAREETALKNELPQIRSSWNAAIQAKDLAGLYSSLNAATRLLDKLTPPQRGKVVRDFFADAKNAGLQGGGLFAAVAWLGEEGSRAGVRFSVGDKSGQLGVLQGQCIILSTGPAPMDAHVVMLDKGLSNVAIQEPQVIMRERAIRRR